MNSKIKYGAIVAISIASSTFSIAQENIKAPDNWFNLDYTKDKTRGVSTEKAYEYLKGKPSKTVIVAVIDGGTDVKHEDLKDKIWVNEKEIAGNGQDDDKNGYVDDVNGWNFIGGKDGKDVVEDNLELTREYVRLKKKYDGMPEDKIKKLKEKDKVEYFEYFPKVKESYEKEKLKYEDYKKNIGDFYSNYKMATQLLKQSLKKDTITKEDVEKLDTKDEMMKNLKEFFTFCYEKKIDEKELSTELEDVEKRLKFNLNLDFDPRKIVGDHYENVKEKLYGNNDVAGPRGEHGTHVAGIIGANRSNAIGMKGVCDNVKLMIVRTVPDGDERDKDVANAIRYAVDNGAKIINMSFGKDFSPNRATVDEAIKYAASKNVLLVHAAGNDNKDVDVENNFPTNKFVHAKNWIEVGASSFGDEKKFVAEFSNYGKKTVDVFAPGVDIYSTVPGSKYKDNSGTSMASPVTAGVAALVLSYFPHLTAEQLKDILVKSTVKYADLEVNKPSEEKNETIKFGELSVSGGIINAYEAVKLAEQISVQK